MFTKKTKIVVGTAALAIVAFAVTGVASARVGVSRMESRSAAWSEAAPMHDGNGPRAGRGHRHLDAAATVLGVTPEVLKQSLADGASLADVATAKGVAVQKVIDAIVADARAKISQAVTDGKLTEAKADAMLAKVVEHATAIVNGEHPPRGFGHGPRDGRDGHGRRGHPHGDRPSDGPTADQSSDA